MSMHPSLSSAAKKGGKKGSVMSRVERIKFMIGKDQWKLGDKVFGLPKIKSIKINVKKEKTEKVAEAAGAKPAVAGAKPAAAGTKPAADEKAAPAKK